MQFLNVFSIFLAVNIQSQPQQQKPKSKHRTRSSSTALQTKFQSDFQIWPMLRKLCRVIGVGDADSYEVQIYQAHPEHSHTKGLPTVVAQQSQRIVSRSHEAKAFGINRSLKVPQARQLCPGLQVIYIKNKYNKPDSTEVHAFSNKIREAALKFRSERLDSIQTALGNEALELAIERTGCDEFLIDLTDYVTLLINHNSPLNFDNERKLGMEAKRSLYNGTGLENRKYFYYSLQNRKHTEEVRLAYGLQLMNELCTYIKKETGIVLSGGVGTNKVIAKLACNLHKPNAVTALTRTGFYRVSYRVPFREVSGFGGELGASLNTMFGDLSLLQMKTCVKEQFDIIQQRFWNEPEQAEKAQRLVHGVCHDPVENKLMNRGLNCGKSNLDIRTEPEFREVLNLLVQNMVEKLYQENEHNKRVATGIKVQYRCKFVRRQASFPMNLGAVAFVEDGKGKFRREEKSFFREAVAEAITNNEEFHQDCGNVIDWINFSVTDYLKVGEVD